MAMLSRRATPETQGEVQGIAAMAMSIGSLVGTVVADRNHGPFHRAGHARPFPRGGLRRRGGLSGGNALILVRRRPSASKRSLDAACRLEPRSSPAAISARMHAVQRGLIGRADHEIGADPPFAEEGIAADLAARDARARSRRSRSATSLSATQQPIVRDTSGAPPSSVPVSASSIRAAMCGTPARMKMLPMRMPGAPDMRFSIRSAPSGTRAIRSRASVSPPRVS